MDSNLISSVNGQHEPVDMPKFLQALKSGADHAVGNRFRHAKKPKSPRNSRPRLQPLIRRRDRNKLPTQKSQNRRNTYHGKVPRSVKQSKPPTPRTQPPLVNTMDRPHKKTCININTRRDLPTYIHHAVHTHLTIFNATRYIRLTYTTLAILLEIAGIFLILIEAIILPLRR